MKDEKELYKEKRLEVLAFNKDMEERKKLAVERIKERGEQLREDIVNKSNRAIEESQKKQEEKMEIAKQLEKASKDGNLELISQLLQKMNEI